jgi:hypothetical protein
VVLEVVEWEEKMTKIKHLLVLFITIVMLLFIGKNSYADIVFPAIAHQFMVSLVVPSYYSVIMAVLVLLVETLFIQKLFTVNYIFSFVISFMINLISSIVGVFVVSLFEPAMRVIGIGIFGYSNMRLGTYLGMIPGYILTVLLEGVLLFLIALVIRKKSEIISCLKVSTIMNFCSYLIILIGIIIADFMTKGANFKTY